MAKVVSLLVLFLVSALCSPVPLLLWSGQRAFLNDNSEVVEALRVNDVHTTLKKLVNPTTSPSRKMSPLDSYIYQGYGHPEVLVAFIGSTMGSSEFAFAEGGYSQQNTHRLQDALSNAQSVLVAPYVFPEGEQLSADLMRSMSANPKSKVMTSQLSEGQGYVAGCDALLAELQENKKIFSNGASDLVLVKFSAYDPKIGECVARAMEFVKSQTDNHLALLSADKPSTEVLLSFPSEEDTAPRRPRFLPRHLLQQDSSDNSTNTGPQYITSTILFGLLLGILLLFILWQALYCMLSIETPARFSYQYPVNSLAKEY